MSVLKTSQLMLYTEIIAVCSQIHTKQINTLCGQNVEFVNVTAGGIYSDHWALEGYICYAQRSKTHIEREKNDHNALWH